MSVQYLVKQREMMLGKRVGDNVTARLKEGELKKEGLFSNKLCVILCPQFLVLANGLNDNAIIDDLVLLKDAEVIAVPPKNPHGKEFIVELRSRYHESKNKQFPGVFRFICPSNSVREEWLRAIKENVAAQTVIIYFSVCIFSGQDSVNFFKA
jgi:hypothetical protein